MARACLDLEGKEHLPPVHPCSKITPEERLKAGALNIKSKLYERGGSTETRVKMAFSRTTDLLNKFFDESKDSTTVTN